MNSGLGTVALVFKDYMFLLELACIGGGVHSAEHRKSISLDVRPWFLTDKRCNALSGVGTSLCFGQRSLNCLYHKLW